MFAAILMFGEPGAEILYPDPGFPIYRSMIEFTGAKPVPVPIREENGFAFSAQETLSLINERTRLVILNSPANPTGGVTPKAEIDALVAGLATHPDVAILSDEIYGSMTYDGEPHVSLLSYPEIRDRLIWLDGASKTYAMTGWRLGWSVWPPAFYEAVRKLAVNSFSCVNAATQHAGTRGAGGAAGLRREDDGGLRCPPQTGGGGTQRPARHQLPHAQGRVLCLSQYPRDRLEGEAFGFRASGESRCRRDRRPGFRHPRRRLSAPLLRRLTGRDQHRAAKDGRFPGKRDAAAGVTGRRLTPRDKTQTRAGGMLRQTREEPAMVKAPGAFGDGRDDRIGELDERRPWLHQRLCLLQEGDALRDRTREQRKAGDDAAGRNIENPREGLLDAVGIPMNDGRTGETPGQQLAENPD